MNRHIPNVNSKLVRDFCSRHDISMLILFGSVVSGANHSESDVDLAIQPAAGVHFSKLSLIRELGPLFEPRQIDLVIVTPNTDPLLLFEIFSAGRFLYENTAGIFEKHRLKAWHLYLDTLPLRQYEKLYNKARIRELCHVT